MHPDCKHGKNLKGEIGHPFGIFLREYQISIIISCLRNYNKSKANPFWSKPKYF